MDYMDYWAWAMEYGVPCKTCHHDLPGSELDKKIIQYLKDRGDIIVGCFWYPEQGLRLIEHVSPYVAEKLRQEENRLEYEGLETIDKAISDLYGLLVGCKIRKDNATDKSNNSSGK